MVDAAADLSGSGPQAVWVQHRRVGQDQAGNFSQFYVEVRYYGNGYGSWTAGTLYWSVDVSGWSQSGAFSIPQSARYDTYTVLYAGYYNRAHDGAGNLGAFNGQASINGNVHSSIGSGTAYFTEPASPRIPKRPSPPPFLIDQITSDSFRVFVSASTDDGGSPVREYLVRVSTNPQADTPGSYVDYSGSGTRTITDQSPGSTRYVTVYAKNGSADNNGYSSYQASKSVTLPAGVYVSDGAQWLAQGLNLSDGSSWLNLVPQISNGTAWEDPTDV
ncbi:minor tail protein [Microbacterium phage Rasovi]|nr:minor tail protein [Microbacterium phage Rasovi]